MPIGGKDAFLSKVTFRRESNWYSKTKQELKDMSNARSYKNRVVCPICKKDLYGEVGYVHPSTGHIVCKGCYDKTTKFKVSKAMEE